MRDVVDQLRALDEWPPTPDLVTPVRARVPRTPSRRPSRRRLTLAIAVTALLVPAAAFGIDALVLDGAEVRRTPALPGEARFPRLGDLGRPTTIAGAQRRLGFTLRVPARLGRPDAVLLDERNDVATLVYRPRDGLPELRGSGAGALVAQARGTFDRAVLGKLAGPGTDARAVVVRGRPGVFLSGDPHAYRFLGPASAPRLAGNTLVYADRGVVVRVEAEVGLERALALSPG